jgi:two-component system, cell cycle response regulator CpdR
MLTILFVEDDTAVRDVVMRILSQKGFTVLATGNAHEALRILTQRPVDLLFTDIILPSMDGIDLAKQAVALRPGLRVLFATGYAQKAAERQALRYGRVLYKPLRAGELVREVQTLLLA